jgi:hypothetical protein
MTKYNVHLFREMRLYFPGIEAENPQAAAAIAAQKESGDAEDVEDCDGEDTGALVDIVGDEDFANSELIAFEPKRLVDVALQLLAALRTVVEMENDRDEASRNFDEERLQYFTSLIAQAEGRQA